MNIILNDDVLKLIYSSYTLFNIKQTFDKLTNKLLCQISLNSLNYTSIYKSMGKSKNKLKSSPTGINCLALLSNDKIISASNDNTLNVWNIKTFSLIKNLPGHDNSINSVIILKDDKICSASFNKIILWEPKYDYMPIKIILGHFDFFFNLLLLPNRYLACSSSSNVILFDCSKDYQRAKALSEHKNWITSLVCLADNKFASGSIDCIIKIWDMVENKYKCLSTLIGHESGIRYLAYYNKKQLLVSGSDDGKIKFWDVDYFYCVNTINTGNYVRFMLMLKNGYVGLCSDDKNIKIWDLDSGYCVNTILGHDVQVYSLVLLKDGRIASSSFQDIIIWNY
jgi:WD40 repeat protein